MQLTEIQYKTLTRQRNTFETLINHGYVNHLNQHWLKEVKEIYKNVFSTPLSITCSACISQGLTKLYPLIVNYERENNTEE